MYIDRSCSHSFSSLFSSFPVPSLDFQQWRNIASMFRCQMENFILSSRYTRFVRSRFVEYRRIVQRNRDDRFFGYRVTKDFPSCIVSSFFVPLSIKFHRISPRIMYKNISSLRSIWTDNRSFHSWRRKIRSEGKFFASQKGEGSNLGL